MRAAAEPAFAVRSIAQICKRVVIALKTLVSSAQVSRNKVNSALIAHRQAMF